MEAMSGKSDRKRTSLDRLADAFVEDLLQASDEEILAEFAECHGDSAKNAADMRALFERTMLATNKKRLRAAQVGIAASRRAATSLPAPTADNTQARAKLRHLLASGNTDHRLTLAARNEDELSDADVLGMLEDLKELDVLPPDDKTGAK
jgi:hypothetical protein